jgi:membrane-bound metal-dependent hydrolase YbcI (DUF457 family)
MADFRTHISFSTLAGIAYGGAGYAAGLPLSTCMVGCGLCSVSGMLPDLDSDSSVPVREMVSLVAAVVPALMIPRFVQLGFDTEQMALAAGVVYVAIRFGVAEIFKHYTVHRGMWHSLPAAAIAGLLTFLIVSGTSLDIRLFKTLAVVLGFVIHLMLDEFWSLRVRRGRLQVKRSFGTAMKLWTTRRLWPNLATYSKLLLLVAIVIGDPYLMDQLGVEQPEFAQNPKLWIQEAVDRREQWLPAWGLAIESQDPPPPLAEQPLEESRDRPFESYWPEQSPQAETARWPYDHPLTPPPDYR